MNSRPNPEPEPPPGEGNQTQPQLRDYGPPPEPPPGEYERLYPGPAIQRQHRGTGKKNMKTSIKAAALNIKGRGNPDVRHGDNKWYHIWQLVREERLGVLIVSESHLDDNHKADIDSLFGRAIRLEFTPDETAPSARAGLAFVLNKNMVKTQGVQTTEIVPGRAMILDMENVNGEELSILGVYAPNRPSDNAAFWRRIKAYYVANPRRKRPDLFGGDTNIVEDAIDRLPAHTDNKAAVDAFDELKTYLRLVDGWRETYPTTRAYTFLQPGALGGSQSRIDRMYVKRDLFEDTFEWDIQTVGINTDHRMVTVRLTTEDAPTLGHGRWVWPAHIIRDKVLTDFIQEQGLQLQEKLEQVARDEQTGQRNPNYNAQTLWAKFKTDIGNKARERARIVVPKIAEEIAKLQNQRDTLWNDPELSEDDRKLSCVVLEEKIAKLMKQKHNDARLTAQVRNRLEGEVIGEYWSRINKPHKPRDVISRLRKPTEDPEEQAQYETNSKRMATMARDYHDNLQEDRSDTPADIREEKINQVLNRIEAKVTPEQHDTLKQRLTLEEVRYALRKSASRKAPGLDGITYE
ncbi:Endonuclease/exonuclease/phosphatase, partial [Favolaschia claudopus]